MFEYHGQPYQKSALAPPDWEAMKAAGNGGEFGGGLPQAYININGKTHRMAQFSAIMHAFVIRLGYYNPRDWQTARYVDPVIDLWADIQGAMAKVLFAASDDQKPELMAKYGEVCKIAGNLWDTMLNHHNGKYIAGNSVTIADFICASFIGVILMNNNSPFQATAKQAVNGCPKFQAYCKNLWNEFPFLKAREGKLGPV